MSIRVDDGRARPVRTGGVPAVHNPQRRRAGVLRLVRAIAPAVVLVRVGRRWRPGSGCTGRAPVLQRRLPEVLPVRVNPRTPVFAREAVRQQRKNRTGSPGVDNVRAGLGAQLGPRSPLGRDPSIERVSAPHFLVARRPVPPTRPQPSRPANSAPGTSGGCVGSRPRFFRFLRRSPLFCRGTRKSGVLVSKTPQQWVQVVSKRCKDSRKVLQPEWDKSSLQ